MKKFITSALTMLSAFMLSFVAFAQPAGMMPPELTDPNLRTGKLDNGLTYYIRHNEYPKGQADFHIAQKVGAVQENEEQNGLAHFLEHMCFNGTKNFPDKSLTTWLETIGVKFGHNLNAHTGTDETVYDITRVPVTRETVIDSCLLILHDWSCDLTLDTEEINKERGVIHEEWRNGFTGISRILFRHAPEFYPGSKYATHNVIGSMDVVDNFHPDVLRAYYKKWYRPDLQAIIVVGDVDVDLVEQKIKDIFSPITMPENPAKFTYESVPDNAEPIIVSDSDKEMNFNIVLVAQKAEFLPREIRNTDTYYIMDMMNFVVTHTLNQRYNEIALGSNPPFAGCNASYDGFLYASTRAALMVQAIVNNKGTEAAEAATLRELRRLKMHGITAGEFQRAVDEYMSYLEKAFNNRKTNKNNIYAQTYISHFIKNEAIADIEYQYNKMKQVVPMLTVDVVNMYVKELFGENPQTPSTNTELGKNMVILSAAPAVEGVEIATKEQLAATLKAVNEEKIEAYVDNTVNEPLMSEIPASGLIVKTEENEKLGFTKLTFANGATVVLKPTTHKENEIIFHGNSLGGASGYTTAEDYANAILACDLISSTGLGKFSVPDLQKVLSGVQASVNMSISEYSESVNGRSTVDDLETMMQLIYLNFTQPREDEAAFNNIKNMLMSQLENRSLNHQAVFSDSLTVSLYNHHPKAMTLNTEMLKMANYKRAMEIYKERFANAGDFTFTFVGSFDKKEMIALAAKYIGSLPDNSVKEVRTDDGKDMVKGNIRKQFVKANEGKQAMLAMIWSADVPYTLENKLKASITGQLMSNNLLASVRENEGAAYSPYAQASASKDLKEEVVVQAVFGLNPDKYKSSEELTIKALEDLTTTLPEAELNKIKEFMLKQAKTNVLENSYWLSIVSNYVNDNFDGHTGYSEAVSALTPADIQNFVKEILKQGNRFELLMLPE